MIKVVWSKNARNELVKITNYWSKRNKSKAYSDKIKFHIEIAINLIKRKPQLGIRSNKQNIRMRLILNNYSQIYEIRKEEVSILQFWDVRQNPIKITYHK